MQVVLFAIFLAFVAMIVAISLLGRARRKEFLRTLPSLAKKGLIKLTKELFDPPPATAEASSQGASIEGTVRGTAVKVSSSFPSEVNRSYMSSGSTMAVVAELAVTVGLRGATPRFFLTPKRSGRDLVDSMHDRLDEEDAKITDEEFAKAWKVNVEDGPLKEDLLTDEAIRRDLMRFVLENRAVQSISITPEGLSIRWSGESGLADVLSPKIAPEARAFTEKTETARIRAATDLAIELQTRILDTIERRVRIDDASAANYRGPLVPDELEPEEEETEEAGERWSRR
jgi:hypothetical protein